jgi:hypothetical protein
MRAQQLQELWGLIALSSIEVEKGKQKTLKNSGKRRKRKKVCFNFGRKENLASGK